MNKERLLKLAKHLKSNNRGLDIFDFNHIKYDTKCGTAGCAIGELPYCFPEECGFDGINLSEVIKIGDTKGYNSFDVNIHLTEKFFDISEEESLWLFLPAFGTFDYPKPHYYNMPNYLKKLNRGATAEQVADNIIAFVENN